MPREEADGPGRLKDLLAEIDPDVLREVMPFTGGVVTMMFTDIVDSTPIKAEMGDQPFRENVLNPHNTLIRECVGHHNGQELKTIGDAFFVGFALPENGVACTTEIQKNLTNSPIQAGAAALRVRIGLHTGTPEVYRDPVSKLIDLSGTDVDRASRVVALAGGGQILISDETHALAKSKEVHDWGFWELKGLGRHRIFEVLWEGKTPERPSGRPWLKAGRFPTRFVGREAEIAEVMDAVESERLVTLTGMGGIGKTRLADEVAARMGQGFEDGVFFVDLADIEDSEAAVVSEIISRIGIDPAGFPDEAAAVRETLRNHRALLVLDNFEAVMSAAPFIGRLLKECPGLRFLVTSQRPLGLDGEQRIPVRPMDVAPSESSTDADSLGRMDGFKLFRDRARLNDRKWEVSDADAAVVAEILESTDGIPLSIELAAARVGKEPLNAIREGLKARRIEFLKRAGDTADEKRHAGIRACVDWSFNLLPLKERTLFPKLSVFVGGFFADGATGVCGEKNAPALLDSLRERSLLVWEESLGKARYRMLPTVREYAAERLGDKAETVRQRHAEHFLNVLDRANVQIYGKEQMTGINRISADLENIRGGMDAAVRNGDHLAVVRHSQAFGEYFQMKSLFAESLRRGHQGLASAEALKDDEVIAGCRNNLGNAYMSLPAGDRRENLKNAIESYEAALRVYTEDGFPVQWAGTQNNLGEAYRNLPTGDRGENLKNAIGCYEAALRVHTEDAFPVDWAMTRNNLGTAYSNLPRGDRGENIKKAIESYEDALRVRTKDEFPVQWAMTLNNLGIAYRNLPAGDRGENVKNAIGCYEAALRVYTEDGFPVQWAGTQNNLGEAYRNLPAGDRGENLKNAIEFYEAALRVYTEDGFPVQWAGTQNNLGEAYRNLPTGNRGKNLKNAIGCFEATLRIYTKNGFPVQWAMTQNNLGIAYRDLETGDRGENVKKAIGCFESAIRGYEAAGLAEKAEEVRRELDSLKGEG